MKAGKKQLVAASSSSSSVSESTLEKVQKLAVERNVYGLRPTTVADTSKRTIAILFVIIDTLFHEDIWKSWIGQEDQDDCAYNVKIFVHAKHPEKVSRHEYPHSSGEN